MRFKFVKGSKVEVLNKREVPSGSWWCAEIVSGNGHNYYVKYDGYQSDMGDAVERVPRKAIRPRPPLMASPSWVPADIVEVFDNSSWKLAEVSGVAGGNYYFVRLLGSSKEFRAHTSEVRLRQSWQNNKWVIIGKESERSSDELINRLSIEGELNCQIPHPSSELKNCLGDYHFQIESDNEVKEVLRDFSRGMKKRPHFCTLPVETRTGAGKKWRAVEKEGIFQHLVAGHTHKLREKVDAVAYPQTTLGEKYMHASLNNTTARFFETEMGWKPLNADKEYYVVPSLEPSDTESTSSSVGSCSTSNSPYRSLHPLNGLTEDLGSHCDESETPLESGSEPSLPTKEELAVEIHRLELHAYRTTLVALHASGPISWEQEALMTNMRLMLHISTDEHLLELRNLVSVETNVPFR